jgi:hypothetical protein
MKEDLAEWLNILYLGVDIDADNFMNKLETGELLVKVGQPSKTKIIFHVQIRHIFVKTNFLFKILLTLIFYSETSKNLEPKTTTVEY